jgi:hypothetical protein
VSDKLDDPVEYTLVMLSPRVRLRLRPRGTVVLVTVSVATMVAVLAAAVWLAPYGFPQGVDDPTRVRWAAAGTFAFTLMVTLCLFARRGPKD